MDINLQMRHHLPYLTALAAGPMGALSHRCQDVGQIQVHCEPCRESLWAHSLFLCQGLTQHLPQQRPEPALGG